MSQASPTETCLETGSSILVEFLDLAERGRRPTATPVERRAFAVAKAISDHASSLDIKARLGVIEFVEYAAQCPEVARHLIAGVEPTARTSNGTF